MCIGRREKRLLFTIGYEATGLPDVIAALKRAGVERVIDVREVANSRRAGFAKRALQASLEAEGIGYLHLRALGTPRAGRLAHRRGDFAAFWPIVDAGLALPAAELALLETAALAQRERICLMCLEADWRRCHRARITARLAAEHGIEATHLSAA